jgi:Peptidase family M23
MDLTYPRPDETAFPAQSPRQWRPPMRFAALALGDDRCTVSRGRSPSSGLIEVIGVCGFVAQSLASGLTPTINSMTNELDRAIVVDFPLRGEVWVAINTPGDRIPSHGTDMLGQRYAYDLLKVDARRPGLRDHPAGVLRGFFIGVPTRSCYAWGAEIYAPFDGEIVRAADGVAERSWIHPLRESILALKNAVTFTLARLPSVLGNHVIMRRGDVFAAFAHLAPGSVAVAQGQAVETGDVLGRVGHTGNSTAPHLHFQLMDSPDPMRATGIPCAFRTYEVLQNGGWEKVEGGIPRRADRIRYLGTGE